MFRLSGLFSLVLAVLCGAALFYTSQSVQRTESQLSQIKQSNESEIETLRVLSVEWDYLNRPERLESLTRNNLDMDAPLVKGDDFVDSASDIPQPVIPALPKIKPDFLQHVSTSKPVDKSKPTPVIQNSERESFNQLIESFSEGETP